MAIRKKKKKKSPGASPAPTLTLPRVLTKKLRPDPENPRKITPEDLRRLAKGLKKFGLRQSIIVNRSDDPELDMIIVGGHQRVKACQWLYRRDQKCKLGPAQKGNKKWLRVPVEYVRLTRPEIKTFNIALNKLGGEFDYDKLPDFLREIQNDAEDAEALLGATGFSDAEMESLMGTIGVLDDELDGVIVDDIDTSGLELEGRYSLEEVDDVVVDEATGKEKAVVDQEGESTTVPFEFGRIKGKVARNYYDRWEAWLTRAEKKIKGKSKSKKLNANKVVEYLLRRLHA